MATVAAGANERVGSGVSAPRWFYFTVAVCIATVAVARLYAHREWGLFGIALGTAMAISIVLMVISSIKFADLHGHGLAARHFHYLNIAGAVKFLAFFGLACGRAAGHTRST